jgi:uncharacterized protein (TIGR02246 family)
MKAFVTLCGAAVVALAMTACNPAPVTAPDTHDADVKAIGDNEVQWTKDYAAKDADKVAAHYADDGILMISGQPALQGKAAIQGALKAMLADPGMTLTFQAARVDVAKSGDLGYTQGTYKLTVTDPTTHKVVSDHGSYVTTYRKQADGSWLAEADVAVSDVPPAKAKSSK